jgi:uncharacterized membrane protein
MFRLITSKIHLFLPPDVVLIFFCSILLISPVIFFGFPTGPDFSHHYQVINSYLNSIYSGTINPRWAELENFGFGGITVRLYPPLFYQTFAIVRYFVGNWHFSTILVFAFWTFLGGLGVYFWAKQLFSGRAAVISGLLFLVMPYRLGQSYTASLFPEFAACSILPFCFAFTKRICKNGQISDIFCLSFFYGLLILTHAPTTVIGSICLLIYGFHCWWKEKNLSVIYKLSGAVLLSVLATSFYWIKAITEMDYIAKDRIFQDKTYAYHLNFLFSFFPEYNNNLTLLNLIFALTIVLSVSFFIVFLLNNCDKFLQSQANEILLLFVVATIMSTILSYFIWYFLPFLQQIQFPWRWLTIVSISGSVLSGVGIIHLKNYFSSEKRAYGLILVGIISIFITFSYSRIIRPAHYLPPEFSELSINQLATNRGATVWWWTIWAREEALNDRSNKVSVSDRNLAIKYWKPTEREFIVDDRNLLLSVLVK